MSFRLTAGNPLAQMRAFRSRPAALGAHASAETEDLQALRWLQQGMHEYLRLAEPHDLPGLLREVDALFEQVYAALQEPGGADQPLEQLFRLLHQFRGQPVFILMGFHGAILFEGESYGYFEFDSPELAIRKFVWILELAREMGVPVNLEFEMDTLRQMCERRPDLLPLIRAGIAEGWAEFINPTLAQPYIMLTGPESNLRQFEQGIAIHEALLGSRPRVYAFSEYALHPQMPQILRHYGIERAATRGRLHGVGPSAPTPIVEWEGLSGARVRALVHHTNHFAGEYYASTFYQMIFAALTQARSGCARDYVVLNAIVDHTVEVEDTLEEAFRIARHSDVLGRHVTYSQLLSKGPAPDCIHHFSVDLFEHTLVPAGRMQEATGHAIDLACADYEQHLLQAEGLVARLVLAGHAQQDCYPALRACWTKLLLAQNHDSYTVPDYRPGRYHRERMHMNPAEFTAALETIPEDGPMIGEKTLAMIEDGEQQLADLISQSIERCGLSLADPCNGVLTMNPHAWVLDGHRPGLHLEQGSAGGGDGVAMWTLRHQKNRLLLQGPDNLHLSLEVVNEAGETLELLAEMNDAHAGVHYLAHGRHHLTLLPETRNLGLDVTTLEHGIGLRVQGFPVGSPLWLNYPMGAELTRKTHLVTSDYIWVRGSLIILSRGNHYYTSDLERSHITNYLYERGRYQLSLIPYSWDDVAWVGRSLAQHQVPVARWPVRAPDGFNSLDLPQIRSESILLQALYPQDDHLLLRALNYAPREATGTLVLPPGWRMGRQVNGLGEPCGQTRHEHDAIVLGGWCFGTFEIVRSAS